MKKHLEMLEDDWLDFCLLAFGSFIASIFVMLIAYIMIEQIG